jgi:hypothetical protein
MIDKIINKESFFQDFFQEYLKYGLGSLSKKDTEILILKLILDDQAKNNFQELDIFSLARDLKISTSKLRNLIKEVQLRNNLVTDEIVKKRIIQIFESNRWKLHGDQIHISVVDPLLRERFLEHIYKANSFADYSFNAEILKIEKSVFAKVISNLSERSLEEIIKCLPNEFKNKDLLNDSNTSEIVIKKVLNLSFSPSLNIEISNALGTFLRSIFGF